jgi:hypothetical protein
MIESVKIKYNLVEGINAGIAMCARSLVVANNDQPLITADPNKSLVALYSYQEGLTAQASPTQANATPIRAAIVRFTTVVTIGDSGLLPLASPGMDITVINAAANSMNIFPAVGDKINALAPNAVIALAAGKVMTFYCTAPLQWHTILTA